MGQGLCASPSFTWVMKYSQAGLHRPPPPSHGWTMVVGRRRVAKRLDVSAVVLRGGACYVMRKLTMSSP